MASIINVGRPTAQKLHNNNWKIGIKYTAKFNRIEAQCEYQDAIQVWERDRFPDDRVTGWRDRKTFIPGASEVTREKETIVGGNSLDTEVGGEEIYLKVSLLNQDIEEARAIKRNTSRININP